VFSATVSDGAATSQQTLCYYCNRTPRVQVGLISNIPGWRLEQVIFPGQRWMFWAAPGAILAIYDSENLAEANVERFPCQDLQVIEEDLTPV
jgi:hypothetical protein